MRRRCDACGHGELPNLWARDTARLGASQAGKTGRTDLPALPDADARRAVILAAYDMTHRDIAIMEEPPGLGRARQRSPRALSVHRRDLAIKRSPDRLKCPFTVLGAQQRQRQVGSRARLSLDASRPVRQPQSSWTCGGRRNASGEPCQIRADWWPLGLATRQFGIPCPVTWRLDVAAL